MVDRSQEFLELVQQRAGMSTISLEMVPKDRTTFHQAASDIARGIHEASTRLVTLTQLVREQGLFNDKTSQINPLIARINSDVAELNQRLDATQLYVDTKKRELGERNQSANHSVKVVTQLKSELMVATQGFKEVLELRSNKLKDQQQRREALTGSRGFTSAPVLVNPYSSAAARTYPSTPVNPYDHMNGHSKSTMQDSQVTPLLEQHQHEQQQLLIVAPQINYYQEREQAITEVDRTIRQLGELFKRLSTVIAQQAELVERIDEDIEAGNEHVERGHRALLNALTSASSNRALQMKLLAVLGAFAVFFMLFAL